MSIAGVLPPRSPGIIGHQDAADPSALACLQGDTAGPVGSNSDAGELLACVSRLSSFAELRVMEVDLDRAEHFLYAVAYAEVADAAAVPGFFASDIDFGDQPSIEARAKSRKAELFAKLVEAMAQGPGAVEAFMSEQQRGRDQARGSLDAKIQSAVRAGHRSARNWGLAIGLLAGVKASATTVIKVVSLLPGASTGSPRCLWRATSRTPGPSSAKPWSRPTEMLQGSLQCRNKSATPLS